MPGTNQSYSKVIDVNYPEIEILGIILILWESENVFRRSTTGKRFIRERIRQDS
jgi:hypothetical protein